MPSVETDGRGSMPQRRAQSGEPVCAKAKEQAVGAQLLSVAERRRGAAFGCKTSARARTCCPKLRARPAPRPEARTGEPQVRPRQVGTTVAVGPGRPKAAGDAVGGAKQSPGAQDVRRGAIPLKSNEVRPRQSRIRQRVQRGRLSGIAPRLECRAQRITAGARRPAFWDTMGRPAP